MMREQVSPQLGTAVIVTQTWLGMHTQAAWTVMQFQSKYVQVSCAMSALPQATLCTELSMVV